MFHYAPDLHLTDYHKTTVMKNNLNADDRPNN